MQLVKERKHMTQSSLGQLYSLYANDHTSTKVVPLSWIGLDGKLPLWD